jgi:hypothetical protein
MAMWANERARNEAIRRMLGDRTLKRFWTDRGPTQEAMALLEAGGGYLSSVERVMLRTAFDLWNGSGKCLVSDLLDTLDEERLQAVAEAILARDAGGERVEGPWFLPAGRT